MFNATDLQISAFMKLVLIPENPIFHPIAGVLEKISWNGAPTAAAELTRLMQIRDTLATCDESAFTRQEKSDYKRGFDTALRQLERAYARATADTRTAFRTSRDIGAKIQELKATGAEAYREGLARGYSTRARASATDGAFAFIIRNFQYRYVNVLDYLTTYSAKSSRKFDLIVPSLVDYDWPIAKGDPTPSSFASQIRVMAEITRITGGRVHSFAPYDPFKHVAYDLGLEPVNPLTLAKEAVRTHGFIGVKIYPPMGFAPFGNSRLEPDTWHVKWLPDNIKVADLGVRLDNALRQLYEWCKSEDVPIMAHTNRSNYPADPEGKSPFKELAGKKYWEKLVRAYSGLRISFGHFGNTDLKRGEFPNSPGLAELMTKDPGSSGEYFFADASYFAEVVTKPNKMKGALRSLYQQTANTDKAPVADRLMYGTDWEMIEAEGRKSAGYFARFQEVYADLDQEGSFGGAGMLSDQFFGRNAANYLGLHVGEQNRRRLEQFYSGSRMPIWMRKVDGAIV